MNESCPEVVFGQTIDFPLGLILPYAGEILEAVDEDYLHRAGWYLCDGSEVSRGLPGFRVIGTLYGGGDSATTFNLPDYRGHILRGNNDPTSSRPGERAVLAAGEPAAEGATVGNPPGDGDGLTQSNISVNWLIYVGRPADPGKMGIRRRVPAQPISS